MNAIAGGMGEEKGDDQTYNSSLKVRSTERLRGRKGRGRGRGTQKENKNKKYKSYDFYEMSEVYLVPILSLWAL
jgi:hypothetical protein